MTSTVVRPPRRRLGARSGARGGVLGAALVAAAIQLAPGSAAGQNPQFGQWLGEVRREALERGISAATVKGALGNLSPIPRVIELDRQQPEFTLTFRQYMDRVVPANRVEKGRHGMDENARLLNEIGEAYGVPPRFLVAFWGIESDFGRITGGFPVIASLATLAFDGRRGAYFRGELMAALAIVDGKHIRFDKMTGSWAGAMGQCQFMPSSFLAFARDHDGDGRKDIWNTKADVFASAANYLKRSGWKGDQSWGRPARLPAAFDPALADLAVRKPLSEWQKLGVRRADGGDLPTRDLMASVVIPDGSDGPAFVVYDNFHVILKWNRSTYFAIAVGSLADRLVDR
jgi:membrane-bound lytic murein transglycosylase B